ncbi:hypothetical protein GBA52_011004 [Prunus armeniaca]|nr:hypothetical protein GBA52_011004 [Prunus armeniaca]
MDKTPHLSISDKDLSATFVDVHHDHLQSQLNGVVDSTRLTSKPSSLLSPPPTLPSRLNSPTNYPLFSPSFLTNSATSSLTPLPFHPPNLLQPPFLIHSPFSQPHILIMSLLPIHLNLPLRSALSFLPATTAYSSLGLSHPPSPLLTSASPALNRSVCQLAFRTRPTHHFTQHTPPLYTTHSPSSLPHLPSPKHYPYLPPTPSFHSTHTSLPALDPLLYHSPSSVKT